MFGKFRNVPCSWFYRGIVWNVLLQRSDYISHYYKILVIYTQGYIYLFVCLFICRKCTLIEVRFASAYCVFWTCFVSFVTVGFMITAKTILGRSETRNLLYFERQRNYRNGRILLILVIRKIPWTILLTDSSCVLKCLSWCMVKLYTKSGLEKNPVRSSGTSRFSLRANNSLPFLAWWARTQASRSLTKFLIMILRRKGKL